MYMQTTEYFPSERERERGRGKVKACSGGGTHIHFLASRVSLTNVYTPYSCMHVSIINWLLITQRLCCLLSREKRKRRRKEKGKKKRWEEIAIVREEGREPYRRIYIGVTHSFKSIYIYVIRSIYFLLAIYDTRIVPHPLPPHLKISR